jgi:hypothetical protein
MSSYDVMPNVVKNITGETNYLTQPAINMKMLASYLSNVEATSLNLNYGTQVINIPRVSQLNMVDTQGRTLINLLGRVGNCEDVSKFNLTLGLTASAVLDSNNRSVGVNSIKVAPSGGGAFGLYKTVNVDNAKYYVVVAEQKTDNLVSPELSAWRSDGSSMLAIMGGVTSSAVGFQTLYIRLSPTDLAGLADIRIINKFIGTSNTNFGYVDAIRLFAITQEEYNAISGMTADQITAKYPYVDDMKPITNPYAIKKGENLLPPFAEWTRDAHATVVEPYKLQLNATELDQQSYVLIPVLAGQTYTLSGINGQTMSINTVDSSGSVTIGVTTTGSSVNIITPSNAVSIYIYVTNHTIATGTFVFDKLMLNLGAAALPFTPNHDQYLVLPTQLASNADGTVHDEIHRRGTEYCKFNRIKTMDLDGSLPWVFGSSNPGVKQVALGGFSNYKADSADAVKYDGKILQRVPSGGVTTAEDQQIFYTNGFLYINILTADSGWGDGYNPTNAEVQAYFYGWKMYIEGSPNAGSAYNYNGTGVKAWCKVLEKDFTSGWTVLTTVSPIASYSAYTNYKLQYQLATPTEEQILPEGDITLHEGLNQIEVGNGMIVRERVAPYNYSNIYAVLNNTLVDSSGSSLLKNRALKILHVFKNNKKDSTWYHPSPTGNEYGKDRVSTDYVNYDPTVAYTVTYIAENYAVSNNVLSIQGEYTTNLKTTLDNTVKTQSDIITRVSVLETQKANKAQSQWNNAALLSGWSALTARGVQYRKIDGNKLELLIGIYGGTTARDTVVAILPHKISTARYFAGITGDSAGGNSAGIVIAYSAGGELILVTTPGSGAVVLFSLSATITIPLD